MLKKCLVAKDGVLFLFGYSAAMNHALLFFLLNLRRYIQVDSILKINLPQHHKIQTLVAAFYCTFI